MIDVKTADVLEWLSGLESGYATAVFCDAPYGIGFKDWDRGVPPVEVWREVVRVCKPGALLMSFGGTRTWHRLAVAIEDAGFQVFDTLMWVHSQQGRPKGHSISKNGGGQDWEGWDVALKPSWDPILLCRAPRADKIGETARVHGTGALWIDGGRIEIDPREREVVNKRGSGDAARAFDWQGPRYPGAIQYQAHEAGRWPTNFLLSCECGGQEHDGDCPVSILDDGSPAYSRFFYNVKASRHELSVGLPEGHAVHPTAKPIDVCQYLSRLLLPPDPYRDDAVLLVPFCGSGSEMIGAFRAGWKNIEGCEKDASYAETARARISHLCRDDVLRYYRT